MKLPLGSTNCQAAIFIYKDDGSVLKAISSAVDIYNKIGELRIEHHREKSSFLSALKQWNSVIDPSNAFLCIYSHSGLKGINSKSGRDSSRIQWDILIQHIPRGLHTIWILGCTTDHIIKSIANHKIKICERILVTHKKEYWEPFLKVFGEEINMDPIHPFDEMTDIVEKYSPDLAAHTSFYRWNSDHFELSSSGA